MPSGPRLCPSDGGRLTAFPPDATLDEIRLFLARMVELASDGRDSFGASWRDQEAAQMLIVKLAEAVGRLSDAGRRAWPGVPWQQIRGMRNRLVHAYHLVDLDVLWETVSTDAAGILAALAPPGA